MPRKPVGLPAPSGWPTKATVETFVMHSPATATDPSLAYRRAPSNGFGDTLYSTPFLTIGTNTGGYTGIRSQLSPNSGENAIEADEADEGKTRRLIFQHHLFRSTDSDFHQRRRRLSFPVFCRNVLGPPG